MTDWVCFVVASGVVVPWLLAGACLFAEWACAALNHCRCAGPAILAPHPIARNAFPFKLL